MKNLFLLPTDKPSILYEGNLGKPVTIQSASAQLKKPLNIYITSDEEIKRGDILKIPCGVGKVKELHWKYGNDNPSYIVEDLFVYKLRYGQNEDKLQINLFRHEDVKKIILTTDQDLIKDGVQAIDDEFLEWFVKNSSCEEIYVNKIESFDFEINKYVYNYKIIIPKEEPKKHKVIIVGNGIPKQEILEEAKLRQLFKNRSNCYADADADEVVQAMDEDCFISTINEWKQDQDKKLYSEGEVIGMLKLFVTMLKKNHTHTYTIDFEKSVKKWFEKFKKK